MRFYQLVNPSLARKMGTIGTSPRLLTSVRSITRVGDRVLMYDVMTYCETFIANGLVSHNCYVPSVTVNKLKPKLQPLGVDDPDRQWGDYVFVRQWDEKRFLQSLARAEKTHHEALSRDGNRAVMFCSTTDPYQVIPAEDPAHSRKLTKQHQLLVRRALELILAHSTINVRILTRSPLARVDFDLFKAFGKRLLFGMSLPTLRNDLAMVYEPSAPAPTQRLRCLLQAKEAGLNVYVAMAPTYPECDASDLEATLTAIGGLDPVTVFHEPINIRAENVARIAEQAQRLGVQINTDVFSTREKWHRYAMDSFGLVGHAALRVGLGDRLHLWPDKQLWTRATESERNFLRTRWGRVSEWPS
jgi:DNA repair photolyase